MAPPKRNAKLLKIATRQLEFLSAELQKLSTQLQDRAAGGPAKRKAAAKKAAATRKANAKKRSDAAKKGARTRAKSK